MDFFNTKKLAALEARIAALEPQTTSEERRWTYANQNPGRYSITSSTSSTAPTVEELHDRLKKVEEEVGTDTLSWNTKSIFTLFYGGDDKPEKLTLRKRVERICEHLKIQFVTEPQRTVIKPAKAKK